jgi:hypothetical protein
VPIGGKGVTPVFDMQEQKNKRLLISLVVLVCTTVAVYWLSKAEGTERVDKDIFRVADFKAVDKVVLESESGKVELTFNGSRWKVNDRYDADRNMIEVLMATLREAEPKRPVAASLQDSLRSGLEKSGVKVSVYSGQGLLKRFSAGGNEMKTQAYFKDEETGQVYLMTIPGYRVYVTGILELTENQWRDKYAFAFNWRNFESLLVEFPDSPSENFKVAMQGDFFGVEGMPRTDTARLNTFLDQVSLLTVNEYLEPGRFTDSLTRTRPFMIIKVLDIAKREYSLEIFREKTSQVPGLLQKKQGVVFNRLKIQPILRPKSFFKAK